MTTPSLAVAPQFCGWARSVALLLRQNVVQFVAYRLRVVLVAAQCPSFRSSHSLIAQTPPRSNP